MCRIAKQILAAALGLALVGCSGGNGSDRATGTPGLPATPPAAPATATATARPEPTATSTPRTGYPSGTRTGRTDIDPVLEALEVGTPAALRSIVRYVSAPCVAVRPQGIGPVALCPAGVPEGTSVDVFPSAPGEGTYIDRAAFEQMPRLPGVGQPVYAIIRQPRATTEAGWPQGDYVVYFAAGPFGRSQLYVEDGKAVLACWICHEELGQPGLEFILPPPK